MATTKKSAFTLIELLVSVAIISMLIALFVGNFDRATRGNTLANDAEVFRSRVDHIKILAGSTQAADETPGQSGRGTTEDPDFAAYYGIYLPPGLNSYYSIVRVPLPLDATPNCSVSAEAGGFCLVEKINLNRGVQLQNTAEMIVAFRTPTQRLFRLQKVGNQWQELSPEFSGFPLQLLYNSKEARVSIEDYTGRVNVQYN